MCRTKDEQEQRAAHGGSEGRGAKPELVELLFGPTTESSRNVLGPDDDSSTEPTLASSEMGAGAAGEAGDGEAPASIDLTFEETQLEDQGGAADPAGAQNGGRPPRRRGHGRNGANAYTGLQKMSVRHPYLSAGDPCPKGDGGTLYAQAMPRCLVRLVGQSPV